MAFPLLLRMAAYGSPDASTEWRQRTIGSWSLPRLSSDPVYGAKLAKVHVQTFAGSAQADLDRIAEFSTPGVDLIALWQDSNRKRQWVHIRNTDITPLDIPGLTPVGFLLSHKGVFRDICGAPGSYVSAASALANDTTTVGGNRWQHIVFDTDHLWSPVTDPAPQDTHWVGDALDINDAALGSHLAATATSTQFAWTEWTLAALAVWLDQEGTPARDVPDLIAKTAGWPCDALRPLLENCDQPASHVVTVVRSLQTQGLGVDDVTSVLPALLT